MFIIQNIALNQHSTSNCTFGWNHQYSTDSDGMHITEAVDMMCKRIRQNVFLHVQVCVTLFWLGRKVSQTPGYTGPQLNLEAFREILDLPVVRISFHPSIFLSSVLLSLSLSLSIIIQVQCLSLFLFLSPSLPSIPGSDYTV